ncbi:MAG: hypothetical protein PWR12_2112 [Eubacteriaceae bacterium]|nr:hypothetical protein [Eubacteriaceae bacterium]MDK2906034.1 hypothetical protein [Eubacteriaceae bacterium]
MIYEYNAIMGNSMPHSSESEFMVEFLPVLLSILTAVIIIGLIIAIISYVFSSIGLYKMAKNRQIDHAWLALIPIASNYILGDLLNDEVTFGSLHIPYAKIFLTLSSFALALASGILALIPYLGAILSILLSIAFAVYYYAALYWLYSIYAKNHRVVFLVLSIIFPFLAPIFIFAIRNHPANDERQSAVQTIYSNIDDKSIIALSLGIVSIVSSIPLMGSGFFTGAIGLIFAIIAMKELKETGASHAMALAGLICSIVGLVLSVIVVMACVACIGVGTTGLLSELANDFSSDVFTYLY